MKNPVVKLQLKIKYITCILLKIRVVVKGMWHSLPPCRQILLFANELCWQKNLLLRQDRCWSQERGKIAFPVS